MKNESDSSAQENQNMSENDILVMFPASKNYPIIKEEGPDPLEDLLNEFSEFEDEDFSEADIDEEDEPIESLKIMGYENWDNLNKLNYLEEIQERIKFLLSEVSTYLPEKK